VTLWAQQMKSVTNSMENAFVLMDAMEANANLFAIATLMVQQMKSVTSLMEVVFAQMDTMENNANLSASVKTD